MGDLLHLHGPPATAASRPAAAELTSDRLDALARALNPGSAELERDLAEIALTYLPRHDVSNGHKAVLRKYLDGLPPELRPHPVSQTPHHPAVVDAYRHLEAGFTAALQVDGLPAGEHARLHACLKLVQQATVGA